MHRSPLLFRTRTGTSTMRLQKSALDNQLKNSRKYTTIFNTMTVRSKLFKARNRYEGLRTLQQALDIISPRKSFFSARFRGPCRSHELAIFSIACFVWWVPSALLPQKSTLFSSRYPHCFHVIVISPSYTSLTVMPLSGAFGSNKSWL